MKRIAERALVLSGVSAFAGGATRRRSLVLMYHNVVSARGNAVGDRSLHLARDQFARQLDHLQRACQVVPLEALIEGTVPEGDRPRVAITFDDAYVGALSLGVEELTRRSLPATIFIPPGLLDQETWWDVLNGASATGLSDQARSDLLRDFAGRLETIRQSSHWAATRNGQLPSELRIGDLAALDRAAAAPGIAFGSHTWSHPNLPLLDDASLDDELGRSFRWLRERYTSFVPYLSYPYGLSSPGVERAAQRAGYRAAMLAEGGWFPVDVAETRFALPRFDVADGLSLDGFRLRLAGLGRV